MATITYAGIVGAGTSMFGPVLEPLDVAPEAWGDSNQRTCARAKERCALAKAAKTIHEQLAVIHKTFLVEYSPVYRVEYRSVPPEKIGTVPVTFVFRGDLKPGRFLLGSG